MLEHNELARALTELPDDLLLEEAQVTHRKKPVKFRRLIAVAAVIALLAGTVGAVSAGITWDKNKVSRRDVVQRFGGIWEEYYDGPDSMGFEKLEYNLPLEAAELPEENRNRIERLVSNYWNRLQQQDGGDTCEEVDFYLQNYHGHYTIPEIPFYSFGTLTDVEEFLGIPLDVPDPLREAIGVNQEFDYSMVWVRIYARPTAGQSEPKPAWVEIRFELTEYAEKGRPTGTITVALTEEAAREGMLVESYSYEREGAYWQEEQTLGGYAVELYGNAPEEGYDGTAGAVYTSGGIGYHISCHKYAGIPDYYSDLPLYASAKEILFSLFADTE